MKSFLLTLTALALCSVSAAQDELPAFPKVQLDTTEGTIVLQLNTRRAPLTVRHFLELVEKGAYEGTIFHRVVPGFVAQGGGYDRTYKSMEDPELTVVNESGNGLRNLRGTIAMARLQAPHSANSQFYINLGDNQSLDPQGDRWGYAVFGNVSEGMDVMAKIAALPTGPGGDFPSDVPVVAVIIEKATILED